LRNPALGCRDAPHKVGHNIERIEAGLPERRIEKLMECLLFGVV